VCHGAQTPRKGYFEGGGGGVWEGGGGGGGCLHTDVYFDNFKRNSSLPLQLS